MAAKWAGTRLRNKCLASYYQPYVDSPALVVAGRAQGRGSEIGVASVRRGAGNRRIIANVLALDGRASLCPLKLRRRSVDLPRVSVRRHLPRGICATDRARNTHWYCQCPISGRSVDSDIVHDSQSTSNKGFMHMRVKTRCEFEISRCSETENSRCRDISYRAEKPENKKKRWATNGDSHQ